MAFMLTNSTVISIECADSKRMQDLTVSNNGILSLKDQCRGYTEQGVLTSSAELTQVYEHVTPSVHIEEYPYALADGLHNITNLLTPVKVTGIDISQLRLLSHKVADYKRILKDNL